MTSVFRLLLRWVLVSCRAALEDHGLGFEEGEQSLASAFPPDPGLLEAAERYAEVGAKRVVAAGTGAQLPSDVTGPVDGVGEYRGVQAVDRVVRHRDRVPLILGRDDAEHRSEDLFLRDGGGVVDVPEDGRLDEPSPVEVLRAPAAGGQRRSVGYALGYGALDAVALTARHQRAPLRLRREPVTDAHL